MLISEELNISDATVRNWIRLGVISSEKMTVQEIQKLKKQFLNGSLTKLISRANKKFSKKTFIPKEYLLNPKNLSEIQVFVEQINDILLDFGVEQKIFVSAILFLRSQNYFELNFSFLEIINFLSQNNHKKQILIELSEWYKNIRFEYSDILEKLLDSNIPKDESDFLGIIYQSLKSEGEKSKQGSYYTPNKLIKNTVNEYVKSNYKVLDPSCGTGQFLLQFSDKINNPNLIYGFDIDDIAVKIARINLIIRYKNIDFVPNIFNLNTVYLSDTSKVFDSLIEKFDFIATNPPWGASFSKKDKKLLSQKYPKIKSNEIFSYFLNISLKLLKNNGLLSFILPQSFLNVGVHKDIRRIVIENTTILKIFELDKIFKNVFTDVIRIDIKNTKSKDNFIKIYHSEKIHSINQNEFVENDEYIIYTRIKPVEFEVIKKVYSVPHYSLKNNSIFGLGIVTGDNSRFLTGNNEHPNVPIVKGKDIEKYFCKEPSVFIKFESENLQQVAPIEKYRAKEKLVYRFISKDLIFAYDNNQYLTLNSANILIPAIKNYDVKVILGLLNSKLYNFIFRKKFNSIKVLRFHIENLPIPKLTDNQKNKILNLVQIILQTKIISDELDNYICEIFGLNEVEKQIINNFSVSQT